MKNKILIIENDALIMDIVSHILETEGYKVINAPYPPEKLEDISADLILLDEWINKREGHMLCKDIKAVSKLSGVPVIIFSTAIDILDIVKVCGADGYVQKPFDVPVLLKEIDRLLPLHKSVAS